MTSDEPAETPAPDAVLPRRRRSDRGVLRRADLAVAAGAVSHLLGMSIPWFRADAFDLGSGYRLPGISVDGFDSTTLTCATVLVLLGAAWALLPAVTAVPVPFPRTFLTAGLAAAAFVLTLVAWLATFDVGFTPAGLLTFLSSVATLAGAAWGLLSELREGGA